MWEGGISHIAVSPAFLFLVVIGGVLFSSVGRKTGCYMTIVGVAVTSLLALIAWVAQSRIENLGIEYIEEFFLFLICSTLAAATLAVTVFGVGILFGSLIAPGIGRVDSEMR